MTDRFGFDLESDQASYDYCISHDKLRNRERKWLNMLKDWDKCMKKSPNLIRKRCRKGIPYSIRGKAWRYLTHSYILEEQHPGLYNDLVRQANKLANVKDLDAISKDLHRTFPAHEIFSNDKGRLDLENILTALVAYKPEHGYCQAMSPVVATLLMHMSAESAFWVMVRIIEDYLPGYYSEGLTSLQIDCEIFELLLPSFAPQLSAHLKTIGVVPSVILLEWFMCIFSRTLPFSCALRIIDMFFFEGPIVLMKTALSLIQLRVGPPSVFKTYESSMELYPMMRDLPISITHEFYLIPHILSIKLKRKAMERAHTIAQRRVLQAKEQSLMRRNARKAQETASSVLLSKAKTSTESLVQSTNPLGE